MRKASGFSVIAFMVVIGLLTVYCCPAWAAESKERVMIGRISFVEGQLLRYVHEEQDWVAIVKDAPFGLDDALYSDQQSRGEFIMPNNIWIRIGGNTQIQMMALKPDLTEVDVASGMARFYNKGDNAVIKATTPFGYVVAYGSTVFDIYVGDTSVEVLSVGGTVDFIHQADGSRYEVAAGDTSVLANEKDIAAGDGLVDADWDDWNQQRDRAWQKRVEVKGDSYEYLPSSLQYEADVFEENGKWETVDYEGEKRRMWRPTRVSSSWAPYTDGRWSVYYGDNCWIPDEPFGYTTHHYGNWVRVDSCGCWYWAPPVRRSVVRVERHYDAYDDCDCDWYPGRVAWIHSEQEVGWIPLAPAEPYYTNHYWGGLSVVVSSVASVAINVASYRYYHHPIVVNQNNFYNVNNYNNVRITNINNTTIINNYRGAAVVNNTVINNFNVNRNRYNFTNVNVQRTPHESILNRIERNQGLARGTRSLAATDITRDLSGFRAGRLDTSRRVDMPRVSNRLVDRNDVRKPITDIQLPQREVRQRGRQAQPISNVMLPGGASRQGQGIRGSDGSMPGVSGPTREGLGLGPHGPKQDLQQGQQGPKGQGDTTQSGLRPVRPDVRRDGRGTDLGGADQGTASQSDRGSLRPIRPGLKDRTGSEQGTADQTLGGQTGRQGLRPVRPGSGGDQATTDQGTQGAGDRRIRAPRFGQGAQPDGSQGTPPASDKTGLRPVRPGMDGQTEGTVVSPRDQRRKQLLDQRQQQLEQRRQPQDSQQQQDPGLSHRQQMEQQRQQPLDQRQQQLEQRRQPQDSQQQRDPGLSRRQQMEQQRQQLEQRRQPQDSQQQQDPGLSHRQQMEQQRQQPLDQRQQQLEQRRQPQNTQRQQQDQDLSHRPQVEQQRQQQMQQRQQEMETQRQQRQQQEDRRGQQMELQRQQQQQQRQVEQQRQQQMQQRQQEDSRRQQMEQQRQQQQQQQQQRQQQKQQQVEQQRQQQLQQQQQQQQRQQQKQQQVEQQRQQQLQQQQRQQQQMEQQRQQQQQQQRQQQIQQQQQQQLRQQQLQQQQQQQKKRGQQQDPNQQVQ